MKMDMFIITIAILKGVILPHSINTNNYSNDQNGKIDSIIAIYIFWYLFRLIMSDKSRYGPGDVSTVVRYIKRIVKDIVPTTRFSHIRISKPVAKLEFSNKNWIEINTETRICKYGIYVPDEELREEIRLNLENDSDDRYEYEDRYPFKYVYEQFTIKKTKRFTKIKDIVNNINLDPKPF